MAELVASVIAIASLAYQSGKTLQDLITGLQQAPRTLTDLRGDLDAVRCILKSFAQSLEKERSASLSTGLRSCFEHLNPSMRSLADACDEFRRKLRSISRSSSREDGTLDWRSRIRIHFQENEIKIFKYRLASHKATLNVALSLTAS